MSVRWFLRVAAGLWVAGIAGCGSDQSEEERAETLLESNGTATEVRIRSAETVPSPGGAIGL